MEEILLGVKPFVIIADFILPDSLAKLSRPFPFAQKELICVLVTLFDQLGSIREQIVKLATTVADDLVHSWLSWFG